MVFANDELVLEASNSFLITMRKNSDAPTKALLGNSKAVLIFPRVKKIGLVLGGMHSNGVMVVGNPYSPSSLVPVEISGGSFGLQAGYETSSLVLFVMNDNLVAKIQNGKFTIEVAASVAFGDIGRNYGVLNDFSFTKNIYAYASNDGFFAGASFGGAIISQSHKGLLNTNSYGFSSLMNAFLKF